jgi:uncharacterized protein
MLYGLPLHVVKSLQSILAQHPLVESALLYGSRAKGTERTGSDIDLALVGDSLQLDDLFRIENDLDDLMLPYRLDIALLHQINNRDLQEHITRVGVRLYERHKHTLVALENNV